MISYTVEIDGKKIQDFYELTIRQSLSDSHVFTLTCPLDMLKEKREEEMEAVKKYIGTTVKIHYQTDEFFEDPFPQKKQLLNGIITGVNFKFDEIFHSSVVFSGYSPDILLHDHKGTRSYENKSLKQIFDEVVKPYPKDVLKVNFNPNHKAQMPYVVQYEENNYRFMKRLAARYGEWFYYNGNELVLGSLPSETITLLVGHSLLSLTYGMNLQTSDFKYIGYDYISSQTIPSPSTKTVGKKHLDDIGSFAFDRSNKMPTQQAVSYFPNLNAQPGNYTKELKAVVELEESRIAVGIVKAHGTSRDMRLKAGTRVQIDGFGIIDNKEFIITEVFHKADSGDYKNTFTAISAEAMVPHLSNPHDIPTCHTQNAVVKDNKDPDGLGRVRVSFFWQEENQMSPWIRIVNPYAGESKGFYFIPEIGDEVMVGFENKNAEKPFVIGSLYHGKHKPEHNCVDQKNNAKAIITRSSLKISFDDQKKAVTVETPDGNKVVVSDDDKSIIMNDQHKNKVKLCSDGIILESSKNIILQAQGDVSVSAMQKFGVKAGTDCKLSAVNLDLSADVNFKAKANAEADLTSSIKTTIKGAMVLIN